MATETTALVLVRDVPRLDPIDGADLDKFESWVPEIAELLAIQVTTPADVERARQAKQTANDKIREINKVFADPTKKLYDLHRAYTEERARIRLPWEQVVNAMELRFQVYRREEERKRLEVAAHEQAKRDEEAAQERIAAEERARKEREEQVAALMPWEIADAPAPDPPPIVHVPVVVVPPPPRHAGSVAKTESDLQVDLEKLVLSTADAIRERGDRSGLQLLQADMVMIRQVCKREGTAVSDLYPGITYTTQKGSRLR